ncbi:phage terminase large subunit family protein [Halorarius halobius]|uniref:phage terminase large subunit family protein n=1 Tax=Halorarius halobius TaxID=2962671 RepID=UPI0020CD0AC5|nr:phage terminase large subunit family protein [Halorarius halobius]
MTDATPSCGYCPHCGATIPTGFLLITYDAAGERSAFAECPDCESVVTPADGA